MEFLLLMDAPANLGKVISPAESINFGST